VAQITNWHPNTYIKYVIVNDNYVGVYRGEQFVRCSTSWELL